MIRLFSILFLSFVDVDVQGFAPGRPRARLVRSHARSKVLQQQGDKDQSWDWIDNIWRNYWPKEESDESTELGSSVGIPNQLSLITQPVQDLLDGFTGGWALSYADLRPETTQTWIGRSFLATNIVYAAAGTALIANGDPLFGFLTDITAIASFNYHYTQLEAYGDNKNAAVRLSLLLDYFLALLSIMVASYYVLTASQLPVQALEAGGIGIFFLLLCWVYEEGRPYIVLHSLWHIFSGLAGYLAGQAHLVDQAAQSTTS